jgi:hypothetical protein
MTLTQEATNAAVAAARAAINDYSAFDSSMVPDDALEKVVVDALTAALKVMNPPATTTQGKTS